MTVHTANLFSFGPAELRKARALMEIMEKENTGYDKGPQIICMDDTDGEVWATGKAGNKISK